MKKTYRLLFYTLLILGISSCQRELSFTDDETPPDPVTCTSLQRIIVKDNNGIINSFLPEYNDQGRMIKILDSASGVQYAITYNNQSLPSSITSSLGRTDFVYDGINITEATFSYPVPSKYEIDYYLNDDQGIGFFYREKNGSLDLMHKQFYTYNANVFAAEYDSLGYIKKDLVYFNGKDNNMIRLLQYFQFGTEMQFGFPQPFGLFGMGYPDKYESKRYNITTTYSYKFNNEKLIEYAYTNSKGSRIFIFYYGC